MLKSDVRAPATATPTAIPSGKLWMVTARASIVVRDSLLFGPSGPPIGWMCGVTWSIRRRKANPVSRPTVTGTTAILPDPISRAGMIRDQTEAATMTPDAKPSRVFCSRSGISLRMKNTKADPRAVPRNGISKAVKTAFI